MDARPSYVQRIPNGANVPGIKALGHADGTGHDSARNAFGQAFSSAGRAWTTALCQADTGGDGQTNGQELGDPCCEWTEGATPRFTTGVSHPAVASSKADPARWAGAKCSTGADAATDAPSPSPSPTPSSSSPASSGATSTPPPPVPTPTPSSTALSTQSPPAAPSSTAATPSSTPPTASTGTASMAPTQTAAMWSLSLVLALAVALGAL